MKNVVIVRIGGVVLGVALVLAAAGTLHAQADPHVGTWVLNLEKSKYAPGTAPKSARSVYSAAGKGLKVATTNVTAAGPTVNMEFTAEPDGKDYPVKGQPDYDTTSMKRVDSHTIEFTRKKGGTVVQTARSAVAKDGKTRTVTVTGVNAQGQKINTVGIWIKQ
jgi:hypothetical protein